MGAYIQSIWIYPNYKALLSIQIFEYIQYRFGSPIQIIEYMLGLASLLIHILGYMQTVRRVRHIDIQKKENKIIHPTVGTLGVNL